MALKHTEDKVRRQTKEHRTEVSEHVQAIEIYLGRNPTLGKEALVQLLTKGSGLLESSPLRDQAVSRRFSRRGLDVNLPLFQQRA